MIRKKKSAEPAPMVAAWLEGWDSIRPLIEQLVADRVEADPRFFYRRRYIELEIEHVDQALRGLAVLVNRLTRDGTDDL